MKLIKCLPELIRLIIILRKFKKHYEKFKKDCIYESQISGLRKDEYLWELYNKNTKKFISENKIENIVYNYMAEVLHGSGFIQIENLNAFTFLHFSLPLIVPIHEFIFRKKKAIKVLKKNYIKDEAKKIIKHKGHYEIITKSKKKFLCKNLVIATPPHISNKLIKIKGKLRAPANAHMFHMIGEIRKKWKETNYNLFENKNKMLAIAHQRDNSYLFYSTGKNPDFKKYFTHHKILKYKYWKPAFQIGGSNLIKFNQGKNLYMIGDNNLCGLEPTYIYGMYCANKILKKSKD